MSSHFHFDLEKAIQVAAVILQEEPRHSISYLRLFKLLAFIERESLQEKGTMVVGDAMVAMDHGPVPSTIYNLVKEVAPGWSQWYEVFARSRYEISLRHDPGASKLSQYEIAKIRDVVRRFSDVDDWELVKKTHEFPEWRRNQPQPGSCKPIEDRDILLGVGMEDDEADAVLAEATSQRAMDRFFTAQNAWSRKTHSQFQG